VLGADFFLFLSSSHCGIAKRPTTITVHCPAPIPSIEIAEKCTLHLRANQTFSEELNRGGVVQKAEGQWRRYGEAHVSFLSEFLSVSGQKLDAAGEADGQFDKKLGLFPYLTLAPLPDGPTFHKKWFR